MYSIDIMKEEHRNIRRMIAVLQRLCIDVMNGAPVPVAEFREIIGFIRNYSDAHHHGKEEKFLFPSMTKELGKIAENLITHGMLVEHDLGRGHVLTLETALNAFENSPSDENKLNILTEAMAWGHLLTSHTHKEDTVVYPFAVRSLSPDEKKRVDDACRSYEENPENQKVREHWLSFLADMEKKYGLAKEAAL